MIGFGEGGHGGRVGRLDAGRGGREGQRVNVQRRGSAEDSATACEDCQGKEPPRYYP